MTENITNKPPSNIDSAEIAKFEAMAPIWWDKKGAFKALHDINVLRVDYIDQHAPLAGRRVLDVGCGGGILSEAMATLGAEVTGIDMGEAPLAVAKLHLEESGLSVDYQHATAEEFSEIHPHDFDVVTCLELLEHVPDPSSVVSACRYRATCGNPTARTGVIGVSRPRTRWSRLPAADRNPHLR